MADNSEISVLQEALDSMRTSSNSIVVITIKTKDIKELMEEGIIEYNLFRIGIEDKPAQSLLQAISGSLLAEEEHLKNITDFLDGE